MPRTALVTGGASGLGAASAARLRADGLTVTTLDVSGPADVTADVTDEAALREVAGRIGPVDVLVNSAGIVGANKPLLETTTQEWQRVLDINVLGTVNTMRVFVPGMRDRGWGRVVNLASMAGKDGNPVNEVELLSDSLMNNDGELRGNNVIKYVPEKSVLGLELGDPIRLTADQFERLSKAFLAELETRFVK